MPEDFDYGYETLASMYENSFDKFNDQPNRFIEYIRKDGQLCMDSIDDEESFDRYKNYKYNGLYSDVILLEEV